MSGLGQISSVQTKRNKESKQHSDFSINQFIMSKHHMDLVMCRATTSQSIGKTCDYCTDRCILCECPV